MVDCQLRTNRVTDPVIIEAMRKIPREKFVPRHLQGFAYVDEDVPLGKGRFLREPIIIARLIQAAEIGAADIVLDIGCNTGYTTAVMAHLAATVVGLEFDEALAKGADKLLEDLNITNAVVVRHGDMRKGYPEQGPYNVIFINGSVAAVPDAVRQQLADGGRLVTVLSQDGHMGSAILVTRSGDSFSTRVLFDAATPTLPGFEAEKGFSF